MMFSFGLMGVFALLGSKEILDPLPAMTGIFISVVGAIGAGIDMKDRC